jgi:hypothetical protein
MRDKINDAPPMPIEQILPNIHPELDFKRPKSSFKSECKLHMINGHQRKEIRSFDANLTVKK